jgi:hypothetical protein
MARELTMSWHSAALFINRDASDDLHGFLEHLGFVGLELRGPVDEDEAGSIHLNGVAIACHNGWTIVYNTPDMFGSGILCDLNKPPWRSLWPKPVEKRLVDLSAGSKIVGFLLEGATGTYGFAWHVGGRRLRLFLHHKSEVVFDEGKPLKGERPPLAKVPIHELEGAILRLTFSLAPLSHPPFELEFHAYDYACPPGTTSPKPKGRKRGRKPSAKAAATPANENSIEITIEDIAAVRALADRIGAEKVQQLAKVLGK